MSLRTDPVGDRREAGAGRALLWCAAALVAIFAALIVNGRPLFYFDTAGYTEQGNEALAQFGFTARLAPEAGTAAEPTNAAVVGAAPAAGAAPRTVDGSRSAGYALLAAALSSAGFLEGLLALHALSVFLAMWLAMRVAARCHMPEASVAVLVALPVVVASFGSLSFYVAYLMPDNLAPVMLIVIATLIAFGRDMRPWEIVLALALGGFAVTSHLSHLAIAWLMVVAALIVAPIQSRRRWWLPPLLVLAIPLLGMAEQKALRATAEKVAHSEVVIKPYITARLIADGPGLSYLETHCPDPAIPTCALYEALSRSDDPMRLTPSHIVFETSERLGSFRLMTPVEQKAVADQQVGFFLDVLADAPVATTLAFARNMAVQSAMISVDMTLPTDKMVQRNAAVTGLVTGPLAGGRLTEDRGWLEVVTPVQGAFYLAALAVVLGLAALPGRLPGALRAFGIVLLMGILANALVCGGISQPATRYGARVVWLVPLAAAVMAMFAFRRGGATGRRVE